MNRSARTLALSLLALVGLTAGAAEAQRGPAGYRARPVSWTRPVLRPAPRLWPSPPPCRPVWIPGRNERIQEQVWIPASERRVWIEPVFETRCDLWGRPRQVLVSPGRWQVIREPGRYEIRTRRVWRAGHYAPGT